MHPPPAKRPKTASAKPASKRRGNRRAKDLSDSEHEENINESEDEFEEEEAYHFIGYVPSHGKVWELDGLKSGPLEVGELPNCSVPLSSPNEGWMDTVRPALRMKMEKYGGSGSDGSNIRFSLLAIVDDMYRKAHDEFEYLKRERATLERSMDEWDPKWVQNVRGLRIVDPFVNILRMLIQGRSVSPANVQTCFYRLRALPFGLHFRTILL